MITPKCTKPKLVKYTFKDLERIAFKVDIVGEEYDMCVDFSKNMWANKKKGEWGRGMMNTDADPYKTERTGIIGEMGYAKLENIPVDMMYREGGDDYDFIRNDKLILRLVIKNLGISQDWLKLVITELKMVKPNLFHLKSNMIILFLDF